MRSRSRRRPDLLILDEPTTGLDATVEAAILGLLASLRRELGVTVLLISHNLAVVTEVCDRVGVLYAGRLVEQGPVAEVFAAPAHPYTRGLLASLPQPGSRQERRAAATDRRAAALRRRATARLHVRAALRLRASGVHRRRAAAPAR